MFGRFAVFLCLFLGGFARFSGAQTAISPPDLEFIETIRAAQLNERAVRMFGRDALPATQSGVSSFRVRYRARDRNGQPVTLSALVVLPENGAPRGLVVANHGTTFDRRLSPSRFRFASGARETLQVVLAFSTGGYALAMPDYFGLGDHSGPRRFPLGKLNASSATSLVVAARFVAKSRQIAVGNRLFLTGYSEGAAVALWAQRELENGPKSGWPTRVAPLCGPYDLSGATRVAMLRKPRNFSDFGAQLFLLAGAVHSFSQLHKTPLSRYFAPRMASAVSAHAAHRARKRRYRPRTKLQKRARGDAKTRREKRGNRMDSQPETQSHFGNRPRIFAGARVF